LDEKKAQTVVDEIKSAGGDAIAVGGDVGADDFPEKILKATIECVSRNLSHPAYTLTCTFTVQQIRKAQPHRE
jgi:heptaprenylglyceryl phosphate synthase